MSASVLALAWQEQAACRGADTALFFGHDVTAEARALCSSCDVRGLCLAYALITDSQGVWAGTTYDERCRMQGRRAFHANRYRSRTTQRERMPARPIVVHLDSTAGAVRYDGWTARLGRSYCGLLSKAPNSPRLTHDPAAVTCTNCLSYMAVSGPRGVAG